MTLRGVVMLTGPTWAGGRGLKSAGPPVADSHGAGFCLGRIRRFTLGVTTERGSMDSTEDETSTIDWRETRERSSCCPAYRW
jgi:hypothetical protein